ncbi:uncharacterized protein LOC115889598 [Sitophilus oryzae]|uniref:Uncharacterized protein LOC115889598 n=1 Tax=Sitophilus oryzae TaxID=7048 RepID=A0A6J2YNE3_SITOR|nr:uncharacterized protein LOC115889598 [Sitophilus oryzae]
MYSDNGTTFIGANHELESFFTQVQNQNTFAEFCATEQISWHFIPPRAPHFGGIWESAVKAVKYHLRRVIGQSTLTYEDFYTGLVQVEACLNSRPLSPLSSDPDDLTPLTPGYFLIGSSLVAVPEPDLSHLNMGRLSKFQHLPQITQHFWKRWLRDYLTELQQRSGQGHSTPAKVSEGEMVVLVDDNLPPLQWPLGRISEIHPGSDGVVRVVTIKTAKGIAKRAVRKICVLPVAE